MKKLLYITAFPPNRMSGGQCYSLNALKDLSTKYKVELIYFTYFEHEIESINDINILRKYKPHSKNCFLCPNYYPIFTRRFNWKILRYLRTIALQYDVLYFDFSQVSIYSLFIQHENKIIRCHDIMAQKFERDNSTFLTWIKRCEKKILFSADKIFVPSKKDVEIVKNLYDIDTYYTNEYLQEFEVTDEIQLNDKFLFFGLWSRKENLNGLRWFIETVFPLIKEKKFNVMGGGLPIWFKEQYLQPNQIEYLGYVENSYNEIVKYKAVIVPLFLGAGIKVKVLDSFSTGTPVIGTNIAFEGIPFIEGLTYLANNSEEFATLINLFISNTIPKKKQLQQSFLKIYNNRHLTDFI